MDSFWKTSPSAPNFRNARWLRLIHTLNALIHIFSTQKLIFIWKIAFSQCEDFFFQLFYFWRFFFYSFRFRWGFYPNVSQLYICHTDMLQRHPSIHTQEPFRIKRVNVMYYNKHSTSIKVHKGKENHVQKNYI